MKLARLLLVLLLACCTIDAQETRIQAIAGVTLIDGTRQPVRDAVIVIDGPRISQVGVRGTVSVPAGATVRPSSSLSRSWPRSAHGAAS